MDDRSAFDQERRLIVRAECNEGPVNERYDSSEGPEEFKRGCVCVCVCVDVWMCVERRKKEKCDTGPR